MKTRLICFLGLMAVWVLPMRAQWKPVGDRAEIERRLIAETVGIKTIESRFVQKKHIDVLNEDVLSHGVFSYKADNCIRLDYKTPVPYLIVINAERMKVVADGRTSVMSLAKNAAMKQMQGMLAACMLGDLKALTDDYKVECFENDAAYQLRITPLRKAVQAYITGITIGIDKKDMTVNTLRLSEPGNNYTEYEFTHKIYNGPLDEARFAI